MPFEFFPNTNFHDMNLDYILEKTQKIDDNMRDSQASADAAKASEEAAKASEDAAKLSEEAAKASEDAAKDYADHIADPVSGLVTDWLADNITQETGYVLDASLTSAAAAAPAKTVGDNALIYRGHITDTSSNPDNLRDRGTWSVNSAVVQAWHENYGFPIDSGFTIINIDAAPGYSAAVRQQVWKSAKPTYTRYYNSSVWSAWHTYDTDISTINNTLNTLDESVRPYERTVDATVAQEAGWTVIDDLPVNRLIQIGNDLPDTFDLPVQNTYSTFIAFRATHRYTNWTKIYVFATTNKTWIRSGNAKWIPIRNWATYDYGIAIPTTGDFKIGLYGDSIVAGVGVSDYGEASTQGEYIDLSDFGYTHGGYYKYTGNLSWASRFAAYMADMHPNVTVSNNGVPGCSPSSCYTYISSEGTPLDTVVDVAIIAVGINGRSQSDSAVKTGLTNIIQFFADRGIPVFVATNTPAFNHTASMTKDAAQIAQLVKAACNTKGIPVYDVYNEVYMTCYNKDIAVSYNANAGANFLNSDNLHPSDTGHELIYNVIKKLVKV